jgi:hypothetical protein
MDDIKVKPALGFISCVVVVMLLFHPSGTFADEGSRNYRGCSSYAMMGYILMAQRQAGQSMEDSIETTKESIQALFDWSPSHDSIMSLAVVVWKVDVGPIEDAQANAEVYRDILFEQCAHITESQK